MMEMRFKRSDMTGVIGTLVSKSVSILFLKLFFRLG